MPAGEERSTSSDGPGRPAAAAGPGRTPPVGATGSGALDGAAGQVGSDLRAQVDAWLAADPDDATRAELEALVAAGRRDEVAARFAGRLAFGTAGLRAELGAGPLRMNRLVVRQAAAGLLRYLAEEAEAAGAGSPLGRPLRLVVGYDARHRSDDFAADTAAVARARGVEVHRCDRPVPTPVLAYAVRHLGADAGVMVTASHNPPADNGFKVYLGDGAQVVPPHDERIAAAIDAVARGGPVPVAEPPPAEGAGEVVDAYLAAITGALLVAPAHRDVRVAYTPLFGVGGEVTRRAFARAGFPPLDVVVGQADPDPDFGGLAFPNPEEPGVLDAVVALAERTGADVALANDPDADRLGVAVVDQGRWRALSGNEIGALLADHLLAHSEGPDRLVATSLVSSRLVERLADAAGVHFVATLTGFKWIVRPALTHPEWRLVFGYEEALGFAVSPVVRDKDGVSAALAFAELTAELRARGSSPAERLVELARLHGLHATRQWSIRFADRHQGPARAAELMGRIRGAPPSLAGGRVAAVRDLAAPDADRPSADVVLWDLDDGSRVVFRPSGTEPKFKIYLEVVRTVPAGDRGPQAARAEADRALDELQADVARLLGVPVDQPSPAPSTRG